MRAFLDLDGVLADFVGGVCKKFNESNPYLIDCNLGKWDIIPLLNKRDEDFWEYLDYDFWANLEKTEEADQIVNILQRKFEFTNIAVLSSPTTHPDCIRGKRDWLTKYFPFLAPRLIPTKLKSFFASKDFVLIDDADHNIVSFKNSGGYAVLIPRPWNSDYIYRDMVIPKLKERLDRLL